MQHTALDMQCFMSFKRLEQSGVLQLLPGVLTGAADRLDAVFGAPPFLTQQQQQDEGSANQAQHAGSGSGSSSSSSKAGKDTPAASHPATSSGGGGGDSTLAMLEALQEARFWMMFIRELQFCIPEAALTALYIPDGAGTIVRLTLVAWSGSCQLLASSTQPSEAVLELLLALWSVGYDMCKDAVTGVVQMSLKGDEPDFAQRMQRKRQMWSSPHYLPWLTVALVFDVYGALLLQWGQLPLGSACSSSSSSSAAPAVGGSSSSQAPAVLSSFRQAWQLACSQLPLLPSAHTMLLQAVGCSSRTVLCAAAMRLVDISSRLPKAMKTDGASSVVRAAEAHQALRCTMELYIQWFHAGVSEPKRDEDRGDYLEIRLGVVGLQFLCEHQIRVLLPAVLLYWAAHTQEVAGSNLQADLKQAARCAGSLGMLARMPVEVGQPYLPQADARVLQAAMQAAAQDLLPLSAAVGSRTLAAAAAAASSSGAPVITGPQQAQQLRQDARDQLRQLHADQQPSSNVSLQHPEAVTIMVSLGTMLCNITMFASTRLPHIQRAIQFPKDVGAPGAQGGDNSSLSSPAADSNSSGVACGERSGCTPAAPALDWAPHITAVCQIVEADCRCGMSTVEAVLRHLAGLFYVPPGNVGPLEPLQAAVSAAPGGPEQLAFCGMMCSILKVNAATISSISTAVGSDSKLLTAGSSDAHGRPSSLQGEYSNALRCCALATTALNALVQELLLRLLARMQALQQPQTAAGTNAVAAADGAAGSSVPAAQSVGQSSSPFGLLPCLVLLGRVILQVSTLLQLITQPEAAEVAEGHAASCSSSTRKQDAGSPNPAGAAAAAGAGSSADAQVSGDAQGPANDNNSLYDDVLEAMMMACGGLKRWSAWMDRDDSADQLTAAGYSMRQIREQMQAAVDAAEALHSSRDTADDRAAAASVAALISTAVEVWQQLGESLNALAVVSMCNNPACVNLSGYAEVGLVNGPTCMCANCRIAHYCSRACQRRHWKQHKPVCTALVAAKQQQQPAEQQQASIS